MGHPRKNVAYWMVFHAIIGSPARAVAEPPKAPPWHLEYVRTPGTQFCPDEKLMRRAVAARLGYDPFDANAPRSLRVTVVHTPERLEALIEARDENEHVITTPKAWASVDRCEELIDNTAVFLVDIIKPVVPPEPTGSPVPARPGPPTSTQGPLSPPSLPGPAASFRAPSAAAQPPRTRVIAHRSPWTPKLTGSLGGGAAIESAPGPAASFTLGAGLRWPRFSLGIEARYDLPGKGEGGEVTQLSGGLFPCFYKPIGLLRIGVEGCAALHLGRIWFTADSRSGDREAAVVLGAGVRVAGEMFFGTLPVGARLGVDAVHYEPPARILSDGATTWNMPHVTFAIRAGLIGLWDVF